MVPGILLSDPTRWKSTTNINKELDLVVLKFEKKIGNRAVFIGFISCHGFCVCHCRHCYTSNPYGHARRTRITILGRSKFAYLSEVN